MRSAAASGSRSKAESDSSAPDHTGPREKNPRSVPVLTSTDTTPTTATQLVDLTACLPTAKDASVSAFWEQNLGIAGSVPTTLGKSASESLNDKSSDSAHTVQDSQNSPAVTQSAAAQQQLLTSTLPAKAASGRVDPAMDCAIQEGTRSAEQASGKAKADTSDSAQEPSRGAVTTLQIQDIKVAPEISLAMEIALANPVIPSSEPIPQQNSIKLSESTNQGSTSTANADVAVAKTQAKGGSVGPVSALSRSAQSSQISAQQTKTDLSQLSAVTTKTADVVVPQAQFAIPGSPAHETAFSANSDSGAGVHRTEESGGLPQNHLDGAETAGSAGVNAARVIQTLSESEMHVGMRSVEFGDISIRTSISQQQLVAQITVDHRDLGNAISSHISLAQAKLGNDLGIHASIEVNQSGASSSGEKQNPQEQAQRQSSRSLTSPGGPGESDPSRAVPMLVSASNDAYRLDIRA